MAVVVCSVFIDSGVHVYFEHASTVHPLNNSISGTIMTILCCLVQALHEALMRQEDLLAYIDRQEEAKFRVG